MNIWFIRMDKDGWKDLDLDENSPYIYTDDFMLSHGLLLLLRDLNTPSMADGHVKW
ncbi:hypothetical protein [Vibrio vulnificus]|uniref:hypothetical protein n=1 Tax=Vibrio vulnificus TaxID=672 RepID=UPI001E62CDEF|nr:hypothetical protein [Vibrio vulnificus]MCD1442627.1 hypothetical protein [Vibrio vulnificus]